MNEQENTLGFKVEPIQVSTTIRAGANRRMIARTQDHELTLDVSKDHGGENAGPTPPECLAIALGGCLLNICRVLAMQKQIVLDDIRITITGEIDPTRAFGIQTDKRAGFSNLSARLELDCKLTETEKENFRSELIHRCPLCDTIASPTPLQISFEG